MERGGSVEVYVMGEFKRDFSDVTGSVHSWGYLSGYIIVTSHCDLTGMMAGKPLLNLPRAATEKLLHLFHLVELGAQWPEQLMVGFVVALEN